VADARMRYIQIDRPATALPGFEAISRMVFAAGFRACDDYDRCANALGKLN